MSTSPGIALLFLASHLGIAGLAIAGGLPPLVCPAGAPIGSVDLRVRPARGGPALPLRTLNRLGEGDTIVYKPLLRASESRKGEVAIVLAPAARDANADPIIALEPKPARGAAEWAVPAKSSVAVFVYGPSGLNRRKVKDFLAKDDGLVAQLADYAEKTAQTEALIAALSSDAGASDTFNAAFRGFASQYGSGQIDRSQTADQQMMLAMRTLNPAMANYDPIAPQSSQRIGQTASLAASVAALFFGSPVGLAAGGTAMLMEMRAIVFPNTAFRSSFAQPMPSDGLGLCGKRDAVPAHTKVAYLWATRIPNIGPPHLSISKLQTLPAGMKAPLPIEVQTEMDWKYLDRARNWTLEPEHKDRKPVVIPVHANPDTKQLEMDLTKISVPPGSYRLAADWDWDSFLVDGEVSVGALGDFRTARLEPESQDRLVAKEGRVPLTLAGSDFQFVTKVELAKPGDKFFATAALPFSLPKGFRGGQQQLDVQVNTGDLDPGDYRLLLTQADGKQHPVPIAILPAPPHLTLAAPVVIHQGDSTAVFTLHGERLDGIASLRSEAGKITLAQAGPGATSRSGTMDLNPNLPAGRRFAFTAFIENRRMPLEIPDAVSIAGPRATITGSRLSLPPQTDVALNPGELPSSFVLSAMLQVKDFDPHDTFGLACHDDQEARFRIRPGEKIAADSLEVLGSETLFLTFDNSLFPNGCQLIALPGLDGKPVGDRGYPLGRIVHIPKIRSFDMAAVSDGKVEATLSGEDLETIERAGWDPEHGTEVTELPYVVPGDARTQMLRISMPSAPVSAETPLYVWLRGESKGRATILRAALHATRASATK